MSGGWFAPAPARRLAILRVLIGSYALVYLVVRAPHIFRAANFPAARFDPVGPVSVLTTPLPPFALAALLAVTIILGGVFVYGARHRIVGPCFALGSLWLLSYRNSWGMVFHTENLLTLHVIVLGVSASADVPAFRRGTRAEPIEGPQYGWPIRLMCAVTVLTYFIAGVTKLRIAGLDWITSDTLRNLVALDNVRKAELGAPYSPIGALLVPHGWLFPPFAAGSMLIELAAPLALLSRSATRIWCVAAWAFHAGVLAVMWIFFPYPLLGFAFLPFFQVERAQDVIASRLGRRR